MSMYTKKIKATTTLIAPAIQNDIYIDVAQMFKANFAEQFLHILFDPNTANPQELNVNEDGCSPHFGQLEKLILIITSKLRRAGLARRVLQRHVRSYELYFLIIASIP